MKASPPVLLSNREEAALSYKVGLFVLPHQ